MSFPEFVASLLLGLLSVLLPLVLFIAAVALCVYLARWWINRRSSTKESGNQRNQRNHQGNRR